MGKVLRACGKSGCAGGAPTHPCRRNGGRVSALSVDSLLLHCRDPSPYGTSRNPPLSSRTHQNLLLTKAQKHVVSQHISRRQAPSFSSFSCEWAGCGNIFISPRELADHLAQQHANLARLAVCFCGEIMGWPMLQVHEKVLPFPSNTPVLC
jgi:hypothetical protein